MRKRCMSYVVHQGSKAEGGSKSMALFKFDFVILGHRIEYPPCKVHDAQGMRVPSVSRPRVSQVSKTQLLYTPKPLDGSVVDDAQLSLRDLLGSVNRISDSCRRPHCGLLSSVGKLYTVFSWGIQCRGVRKYRVGE